MQKFIKSLAIVTLIVCGTSIAAENTAQNGASPQANTNFSIYDTDSWLRIQSVGEGATIWKAACCKVCRKGKACGNSCISRSYTCRKGKGCACNG